MAQRVLISEGEFMNFIFDIIVHRSDIYKLNLNELFVTWGEESFSHDPPQYDNGAGLAFVQNNDMEYYQKFFGKFIDSDFNAETHIALSLAGEHVVNLEILANKQSQEIAYNKLILFLDKLIDLDFFLIFFIRDEEYIDTKYRVHTKEDLVNKIRECLSWSSPEGAVFIKS